MKQFGIHWYSEGDVFYVVSAEDVRQAVELFLAEEYKLISEVEPTTTLTNTVHYHTDGSANIEIIISYPSVKVNNAEVPVKDLSVLGIVVEIKDQNKPVLVQDLVQTSIEGGAVTHLGRSRSASKTIQVILVDKPSRAELETHPLNL